MTEPIYALDLDEDLLSHLPDPEAWVVLQGERVKVDLIEDDFVAEVFEWQRQHLRKYTQPASASVLADQFDLDLAPPETVIGDLIDRLRERYAKNKGREALREVIELQKDDPIAVPQALMRKGRELNELLATRGEMFGTGDVDRAEHRYHLKVQAGPGASFGHVELDEYFFGMKGLTFWVAPPKTYKALAWYTPIPTPTGWTTMASLRVGDHVFDEHGKVCSVIGKSQVWHNRPCFRVQFSDKTSIIADADHLWQTRTRQPEGTGVHTTAEIAQTLLVEDGKRRNHAIPVTSPLQCPDADLPIDPYVLGAWLGDGTAADAAITTTDDAILDQIRLAGYTVTKWASVNTYGIIGGFRTQLRTNRLLKNKHIPIQYRRASVAQRWRLLQGLMDTDGSCTNKGDSVFVTTNRVMKYDVLDLIRGLGFKPVANEYRAMLNGKDCGPKWHISFAAHSTTSVFCLDRKLSKQRVQVQINPRSRSRQIVSIEPVPSVPVQCISVDSPNHLYLAGNGMVPTHNSWAMLQGVVSNAEQGKCAWLYSLELPTEESDMRLRCLLAGVPWWHYIHNCITAEEWESIRKASEIIDGSGIYKIVKPPQGKRGLDEMVYTARDAGADVIFFDQLQYMETTNSNSLGALNNTGEYWNVLNRARDLSDDGPICIAHQFNRSAMFADSMPAVEQAKGSSAIEETATLALGMWANKDMRRSGIIEVGTLIARNHMYASWEMKIDLSRGCSFEITHRIEDND